MEINMFSVGLGIDAGGTYTDAVIYDMPSNTVAAKAKALSTQWDFTIGIGAALSRLSPSLLARVELVALSTTLATNAIVEDHGQKVGMLLMPPAGRLDPDDIRYEPKAALTGQLTITGQEISPIDEDEVRRVALDMVQTDQVEVFAVSGYAGCINPRHEIEVKRIVQQETGLLAICGHELSDILNFRTRAHTAMLNARIIPLLERLLTDLEQVLRDRGIDAPVAVVKGDGTLMSSRLAKQRPVETILSGPAASVSGAQLLTGLKNAVIVDMGGTTTDIAVIENGVPEICESGAMVGGFRTHVKAMNIRTEGLGGDSLIQWNKGEFAIGPTRVAPISWLAGRTEGTEQALEKLERNLGRYRVSSRNMQIITLLERPDAKSWQPLQAQILELLAERPRTIDELLQRTGSHFVGALGMERLEQNGIIQRCGLTPTDLLHIENRFCRWNREAALSMGKLLADICGRDLHAMAASLLNAVAEQLTLELLKKQLEREGESSDLESGPVCRTLVENMLTGGNHHFTVKINLHQPVIGIGAPIHFFLPQATATLSTKALIPEHADVANAVGAVTSRIFIRRKIDIISPQPDCYQIVGLAGVRNFSDLDEASRYAAAALIERVREIARAAGTSAREVDIRQEDRTPQIADGSNIFLGRTISAQIIGAPDLVLDEFKKRASK
jgi:N-methylhydantoinase A/oxoprolinase/acetone carboxylase beta subunit